MTESRQQRLQISHGRLLDPAQKLDIVGDLYIADGHIISLLEPPDGFTPDLTLDAKGQIVCPSLLDLGCSLCPNTEMNKAALSTASTNALAHGISHVCVLPDTQPVIDNPAAVEFIQQSAAPTNGAYLYPIGALTRGLQGKILADMYALQQAGCIAVSNARAPLIDLSILRHTLEYAASLGLCVWIFPEDPALKGAGIVHEGAISSRLGLPSIPESAETSAIAYTLLLAEQTGAKIHFCRLSTAKGVQMIAAAKQQGLPVTADVGICHLHLHEMDVLNFNAHCHLSPPLRRQYDQQALRAGLADGTIDAICSDHQTQHMGSKENVFSLTTAGAATMELLLPLSLHLADTTLTMQTIIRALTYNPAQITQLAAGTLSAGAVANICVFDPHIERAVGTDFGGTQHPFSGWHVPGKVSYMLQNGMPAYRASDS